MEMKFLESVRLQTAVVCLHEIPCPELPHLQPCTTHYTLHTQTRYEAMQYPTYSTV